jgi:hypothetical protein
MALPIWAEYMQRVYADSLELGLYAEEFDIPASVDALLDCGSKPGQIESNNIDDEF